MQAIARPHRGGSLFALGVASVLIGFAMVPLGIVPWVLGWRDLRAMSDGRVDPSGRKMTQLGTLFGIAGTILAAFIALLLLVFRTGNAAR
jgi:hypothetical protein